MEEMMSDYLEHYGIKGMKWGVRRTPEQLGHKPSSKKKKSSSQVEDISKLSDEELRRRLNRINMEQQYKAAMSKEQSSGKRKAISVLKTVGKTTAAVATVAEIWEIASRLGKAYDLTSDQTNNLSRLLKTLRYLGRG